MYRRFALRAMLPRLAQECERSARVRRYDDSQHGNHSSDLHLSAAFDRDVTDIQELSSCWDGRPFGHNTNGPKIGGSRPLCPFPLGGAGPIWHNVAWAEA